VSKSSQVRSTYFRFAQLEDSALRRLNIESWSLYKEALDRFHCSQDVSGLRQTFVCSGLAREVSQTSDYFVSSDYDDWRKASMR
jgi:hypothetical protein